MNSTLYANIKSDTFSEILSVLGEGQICPWLLSYLIELLGPNPSDDICQKVQNIWNTIYEESSNSQKTEYHKRNCLLFTKIHNQLKASIQLRYNPFSISNENWDSHPELKEKFEALLKTSSHCKPILQSISKCLCALQMRKLYIHLCSTESDQFEPSTLLEIAYHIIKIYPYQIEKIHSEDTENIGKNGVFRYSNTAWIFNPHRRNFVRPYLLGHSDQCSHEFLNYN